jgi:hypothetical protein
MAAYLSLSGVPLRSKLKNTTGTCSSSSNAVASTPAQQAEYVLENCLQYAVWT